QRNMIVDEARREFQQTTSQVGSNILKQLSAHCVFYGSRIIYFCDIRTGRGSQCKQAFSLCNRVCAKLFETEYICCKVRLLDLRWFLELRRKFIEAKYFAPCRNGIAFIHQQ